MKYLICALLIAPTLLATERHILMISDSRGNCSFAKRMIENFYSLENTSFKIISVGGSSPRTWTLKNRRLLSPYGHTYSGTTANKPETLPKYFKLGKTRTPYFEELLQSEFLGKDDQQKIVIINMGYNAINSEQLFKNASKMLKLVQKSKAQCIWIGTPATANFREDKSKWQTPIIQKAIAHLTAEGQAPCQLIDSTQLTHYPFQYRSPKTDGIHYCWHPVLEDIAFSWADQVFDQIHW